MLLVFSLRHPRINQQEEQLRFEPAAFAPPTPQKRNGVTFFPQKATQAVKINCAFTAVATKRHDFSKQLIAVTSKCAYSSINHYTSCKGSRQHFVLRRMSCPQAELSWSPTLGRTKVVQSSRGAPNIVTICREDQIRTPCSLAAPKPLRVLAGARINVFYDYNYLYARVVLLLLLAACSCWLLLLYYAAVVLPLAAHACCCYRAAVA